MNSSSSLCLICFHSQGIKFSSIYERTLLDLNSRQHLVLLESLKQSSQIRLDHDVFFYMVCFGVLFLRVVTIVFLVNNQQQDYVSCC